MKRTFAVALLLLAGLGLFSVSEAQFPGTDPLTLIVNPSYPKPFQSVIITPQSSSIDLTSSTVVVTVDGKEVSRGSGAEAAYVTVGAAGTATTVRVTATNGGQSYSKSVTIRPADVALIIEPGSTTHPFYEGGSLIAAAGVIRFVAIPDIRTSGGAIVPPANLVYTWKNGEQILEGASGVGKSVLTANAPVKYRDASVSVTVSTQDTSIVAQATAPVLPATPYLRVYRTEPLLGTLFGTALPTSVAISSEEESFLAVPYYFSSKPAFNWELNGVPTDSDESVTVRPSGTGSGTARLSVSAQTPGTGEGAIANLSISFGSGGGLGIFGL